LEYTRNYKSRTISTQISKQAPYIQFLFIFHFVDSNKSNDSYTFLILKRIFDKDETVQISSSISMSL